MVLLRVIILIPFFLVPEFKGEVTAIIDGDTIEVLRDGKAVRIRLNGIDSPEKSQPFGMKAKQFMSDLIYEKKVVIKEKEIDRYGRLIADVYLQDGTWVNKSLVENGLAWHYKYYSSDAELALAENLAKISKTGLWQDSNPIPPWDYRRKIKK